MKLGDILIDTDQTQFELILPNKGDKKFNLIFAWPYALVPEGQIILFNNYGKALWSTKVEPQFLSIVPNKKSTNLSLRSDVARMTSAPIDIKVLNEMKYLPFIKFCIHKLEDNSRLQLCSREFYFSGTKDDMQIKSRSPSQKQSRLIINDQVVNGGQAIILLNDPKQNLNLKALSENGALLEFETRMSPVDFQDVFVSENGATLNLRAEGALPAKQDKVELLEGKSWKAQIPVTDPVLYLRGAGGLPMRQEFYLRGPVPAEAMRPYALAPLQTKTYSDQIIIDVRAPENAKVIIKDKNSGLKSFPDGHFLWLLKNLDVESDNKRFMSFKTANSEFSVSHKVQKGTLFHAKVYGVYEPSSSLLLGNFVLDWWSESFLGARGDSHFLRWGLQIEQILALSRKDDFMDYSLARTALMYRFKPGFNFVDPTWGIKIPFQSLKTSLATYNSFGLGVFYQGENPSFGGSSIDWFNFDLTYYSGASNSAGDLRYFLELNTLFFLKLNNSWSWSYGASLIQGDFENNTTSSKIQMQGKLGLSLLF